MKNYLSSILCICILLCSPNLALKAGVVAGPHADIMNKVKEMAKKKGLDIEIIEFNDFILPNEALASKDIDLNSYQHEPYLNAQMESRSYKFKAIAKTVIMPMGLYSNKVKSIDDLPKNAKISVPNDPTNGGRALKLLAKYNVIQIKDVQFPTTLDIITNPKNVTFMEIDAALVPRSLDDVDAAIINTDWVVQAKLDPKSAIVSEGKDSPYVNVIVVRAGDEAQEDIQKLVSLYHTPEIRAFIDETYKGAVIPAW